MIEEMGNSMNNENKEEKEKGTVFGFIGLIMGCVVLYYGIKALFL